MNLAGVFAYPPSPMSEDGEKVDLDGLEGLLNWLAGTGVHGVIPLGSTGEFAYLDSEERRAIALAAVQAVGGRVPVLVSVSALSTRETMGYAEHAASVGADGLMLSVPTYYALDGEQVAAHVRAVAEATALPLMLYNNPYTSLVDITTEVIERLIDVPTVVAIKEASKDINRIQLLVSRFGERLTVLGGGFDPYALPAFAAGARGWTTAMACLVPELCLELHQAAVVDADLARAKEINERLAPLANLLLNNNLSAAVKCGLSLNGRAVGVPRRPLSPVPSAVEEQMRVALKALGAA